MKKSILLCLLLPSLWGIVWPQDNPSPTSEQGGAIKGRILDYETQKPLAGVTIAVRGTERKVQSDAAGLYELLEVPVGYYVLTFQFDGYYSDTRTDVIVRPDRVTFLNVEMLAARSLTEEVRVTADYFPTTPLQPGSRMQLNAEELRRDAASAGDVSRALYNVPGIVKIDEEANDLIVRGGSPVENGFYVDNIFVPNINHFPQWGASGGNISMLNMKFIDRLDIYTGGFDASYGNRLSSITDIGYREGNRERINGLVHLGIIGYGGQFEGPLPGQKGAWMISGNKSTLELIGDAINDTGDPGYFDIQGKATYDLDAGNRLSLLAIGGRSQTIYHDDRGREKYGALTAGLGWRHLWGGRGWSDTSLSYSGMEGSEDIWDIYDHSHLDYSEYRQSWLTLRNVTHLQLFSNHQLRFGFEFQKTGFRSRDLDVPDNRDFDGTFGAAFATYVVYPFPNVSLASGLRLDYFPLSERFHVSPRLSFAWILTERLSLNGAFGLFYQQLPLFLIQQHPDNVALQDPQARHLVLGFKYLLRQDTQLTLEAYDKQYEHFPMTPRAPYYFVLDNVIGDEERYWDFGRLVDEGKAYARGIELAVQKKMSENFYGFISFSYFRARYRDLMGAWRNRLLDHRFILCVSGGYKPNRNWEINGRWVYSGNKAFTPVDEAKSRQMGWPWVNYEDIMSGHLSDYRNLSVRIERRFYFKRSNLVFFIGALNVFDHQNELYREWISRINAYDVNYMWGRIPYLGLEYEF